MVSFLYCRTKPIICDQHHSPHGGWIGHCLLSLLSSFQRPIPSRGCSGGLSAFTKFFLDGSRRRSVEGCCLYGERIDLSTVIEKFSAHHSHPTSPFVTTR